MVISPAFGLAAATAGPNQYDVVSPPAWVDVLTPSLSVPSKDSDSSSEYLLVDNQVRLGKTEASYSHLATRIVTEAGVDDESQINISFDSKREKLHLHGAVLHRGNRVIDELKTGRVQVLREERERGEGLVRGELTFSLILSDVRVGDVVDYSYTIERLDSEWNDRHFGRHPVEWNDPVVHQRLRFSYPAIAEFHVTGEGKLAPKTWDADGWAYWELDRTNVPGVKHERRVPSWVDDLQAIQYSQFKDWREVVQRALPLYQITADDREAAGAAAQEVTAGMVSEADRLVAVMKFVQSQVRYTGIEEGEGAFRPTSPRVVLQRRYGDCKDKALLAVTMLQSLNISASPALVSTDWQQTLATRLASPGNTDHVVVRVLMNSKTYWFDATSTGQEGTLEHFTQAHFGTALVIAPGISNLEAMPGPDVETPHTVIDQQFDLRATDGSAKLLVTTNLSGSEADGLRRRLASDGKATTSAEYRDYYRGRYPNLTSSAPSVFVDDTAANVMTMTESYAIPAVFARGKTLQVLADEIVNAFKQPDTNRHQPYILPFPMSVAQRVRLLMPRAWPVQPENISIHTPEFSYDSTVSSVGNEIFLSYNYKALTDHIAVSRIGGYLKDAGRARDDVYYRVKNGSAVTLVRNPNATLWPVLAFLVALLLLARLLPSAVWMRAYLALRGRSPQSEACSESDVPPEDLHFIRSLDDRLNSLGFEAGGYLKRAAASHDLKQWEYVRLVPHSSLPVTVAVTRRDYPELKECVNFAFTSRLTDGRVLVTMHQARDPAADPVKVLSETLPASSVEEMFERHRVRLEKAGGAETHTSFDLVEEASFHRRHAQSLVDRRRALGMLTSDSDGRDRFTWKGAALMARTALKATRTRQRQARKIADVSAVDYEERAKADYLAVSHALRDSAKGGIYWPLTAFNMLAVALAFSIMGLLTGWGYASSLLVAVIIHEAGHLLAMRFLRINRAPLMLLPQLGILPRDVPGSASKAKRAAVVAAGPLLGSAVAACAILVNAYFPLPFLFKFALDLIFVTAFSLIPMMGSDITRFMDCISSPASRWRYMPCLLIPVLLAILCMLPVLRDRLLAICALSILSAYFNLRRIHLLRLAASKVPRGADWNSAVRSALEAMAGPRYGRWQSGVRQLRAMAIADQFVEHQEHPRQVINPAVAIEHDS